MNKFLLKVKNLNVRLDFEHVIKDLSFQVFPGDTVAVLGPNGSGKSVLIKTILGLIPYSGEIQWGRKYKIGYLPQGLNQLSTKNLPLTVSDFFNLKDQSMGYDSTLKSLSTVGLGKEYLKKVTGELSGGEFQRMLLAWVLSSKPEVVFLDEPTTGIDVGGGETIYSLLRDIKQRENLTVLLVTHDLNVIYGFTDKVLCLSRKGHTCFGNPREVISPKTLENIFGMKIKFYQHK